MTTDEKYMLRAIELAKQGEGLTRPNPPVGAVLVLNGRIVAEGWHEKAGSPHAEEDDRRARLAIRYILCNPVITAPIPGLISPHQVDNMAKAVKERRELDVNEKAELDRATSEAWAKLPVDYQWLRDWEYV